MNYIGTFYDYSTYVFNTCKNNFQNNNTRNPPDSVIRKVMTAALLAGILTLVFNGSLAPVLVVAAIVGVGTFIYETLDGKDPPSEEFLKNARNSAETKASTNKPKRASAHFKRTNRYSGTIK